METIDINTLVNEDNYLVGNIPMNKIIIGKINEIKIHKKYNYLNLFHVECNELSYYHYKNIIKNHIFPNSLKDFNIFYSKKNKIFI